MGYLRHIDHRVPLRYKLDGKTPTLEEVAQRLHYANTQSQQVRFVKKYFCIPKGIQNSIFASIRVTCKPRVLDTYLSILNEKDI